MKQRGAGIRIQALRFTAKQGVVIVRQYTDQAHCQRIRL